jgi:hypothetical protein
MDCLPLELHSRILSYLSNRKDIAVCRLLSKQSNAKSIASLLPRLTIAKRDDQLAKTQEVLDTDEYPDFRDYVTEIVWDTSTYENEIEQSFEDYIQACDEATRVFRDPAAKKKDADTLHCAEELESQVRRCNGMISTFVTWKIMRSCPCGQRVCTRASVSILHD